MYTEALDELHSVLLEATIYYLKDKNKDTPANIKYVNEAIKFSLFRKFSFENFNDNIQETFSFDFTKAA